MHACLDVQPHILQSQAEEDDVAYGDSENSAPGGQVCAQAVEKGEVEEACSVCSVPLHIPGHAEEREMEQRAPAMQEADVSGIPYIRCQQQKAASPARE